MNNGRYRIAVTITNRTNYTKLKLVLKELSQYAAAQIELIASSSILLDRYGAAYRDIERDGFKIDVKIDCLLMNDSHEAMVNTAGLSMIQHSSYFASFKPDMLLIVGDRFDALPPALAAGMMNIPVAHIQGGETSGTIDNKMRDLISKMATLHFVATEMSGERLVNWGVEPAMIFNHGCPAVEYVSKVDVGSRFDPDLLKKRFKREIDIGPEEDYFLVIIHPDTTNDQDLSADTVLGAVSRFSVKTLVFYPNIDANNQRIVADIARHNKNERFFMIRHMPIEGFAHAMAHCRCMIGNSSAGIREAALFGTPVINIGERQKNRERNPNVVDVPCRYEAIVEAIGALRRKRFDRANIYYKADCSKHIAQTIMGFLERHHAA
jgi:UDP-hydrolysing UDP-N-acetyl-D-glucosamine 2-epimerase